MNGKRTCQLGVTLGVALAAGAALGAVFTWTDGAIGLNWDQCDNWDACNTPGLYPQTTADDAIIPQDGREWGGSGDEREFRIRLITEEIDDLYIKEDTDIGPKTGETDPRLTCDSVEITGETGSVRVKLFAGPGGAGIVTQ